MARQCIYPTQLMCNNVKRHAAGNSMCSKYLLCIVLHTYHDQYTNFLRSAYDSSTNKHKQLGCSSAAPDNMFSHILCPACSSKIKEACCCFCRRCKLRIVQGELSCTSKQHCWMLIFSIPSLSTVFTCFKAAVLSRSLKPFSVLKF